MLKLGFLLLLVAGPFFLIIGIHPGFGRVVAIRWFEMLVGVLLKQIAVALTLSVLLYCYSLIMGTTDQALPWALKIMMIALVTVTVVIYRKPFQHLFSSVGYGMLGADERAQVSWRESAFGFRRVTAGAAGVVVPGMGARATSRWARRGAADAGGATDGTAADAGGVAAAGATDPGGDVRRARRGQPRHRAAVAGRGGRHRRQGGAAAAAVTARQPARERPLGGLGPQRRRGDRHRGARAGAAAGTPERRAARGTPERSARADVTPDDRKRVAGGSQPTLVLNPRMERPGERESLPRHRSGHDRAAGPSSGGSSWN